ncbi:MAG: hypothetical protein ACYSW0_18650 [Planctomycetota bacterium]|jgi:hypothetical protein
MAEQSELNLMEIESHLLGLTYDQLQRVVDLVHDRMDQEVVKMSRAFTPGDNVKFHAKGKDWSGIVRKVHKKSVKVATDQGPTWRVHPIHLEKAD